jgi:hypothetical protein
VVVVMVEAKALPTAALLLVRLWQTFNKADRHVF